MVIRLLRITIQILRRIIIPLIIIRCHSQPRNRLNDAGCFVEILLTVVVAIALWIFCPSDQKMTTEISREVADEAIQYVGRLMEIDQYIDPNADHLDDEEVVRFAKKYGSIDIKNYGVVKLGYFTLKGKKKEHLAGIGICGFVITKSIADKL